MNTKPQHIESLDEKILKLKRMNAKLEFMLKNEKISPEDYTKKKREISKRFKALKQMKIETSDDTTSAPSDKNGEIVSVTKEPNQSKQNTNANKQTPEVVSPYAPPQADITNNRNTDGKQPHLWNPNAAANWSLLFSPILGAILVSKNWQELGESEKARASQIWIFIPIVAFIISLIANTNIALPMLILWYFIEGRKQLKYVKEENIDYIKKPWGKVLAIATGVSVAFLAAVFLVLVTIEAAKVA